MNIHLFSTYCLSKAFSMSATVLGMGTQITLNKTDQNKPLPLVRLTF